VSASPATSNRTAKAWRPVPVRGARTEVEAWPPSSDIGVMSWNSFACSGSTPTRTWESSPAVPQVEARAGMPSRLDPPIIDVLPSAPTARYSRSGVASGATRTPTLRGPGIESGRPSVLLERSANGSSNAVTGPVAGALVRVAGTCSARSEGPSRAAHDPIPTTVTAASVAPAAAIRRRRSTRRPLPRTSAVSMSWNAVLACVAPCSSVRSSSSNTSWLIGGSRRWW
jgi:hypothetical protein